MTRNSLRPVLLVTPILVGLLFRLGALRAYPSDVFTGGAPVAGPTVERMNGSDTQPYSVATRTGAAQYSFPIVVPPGRRGMQPSLALEYSSQAPLRGGVAAGWSLPIPQIRVDTSSGRVDEVHYMSTLAGGSRLVEVYEPQTPVGSVAYRAQVDSSFTRYQHVLGPTPNSPGSWVALLTDGTRYTFGDVTEARDEPPAGSDAKGARWFVTRIQDRLGNAIVFNYTKASGYAQNQTVPIPMDITLGSIEYTVNDTVLPALNAHARLDFVYAEEYCPGSDIPIGAKFDYRTGIRIYEGAKRLTGIVISARDSTAGWGSARVRRLITFGYDMTALGRNASGSSTCEGAHAPLRLLTTIDEQAWDRDGAVAGETPVSLPRITFTYGALARTLSQSRTIAELHGEVGRGMEPLSPNKGGGWPTVDEMWTDLDGDGRLDVLRSHPDSGDPTCRYDWSRNTGTGFTTTEDLDLPTHPWADANDVSPGTRNPGGFNHTVERETCALSHQFTRRTSPVPEAQSCGAVYGSNYLSYRFIDIDGDGDQDVVTALDRKYGKYWPENDVELMDPDFGTYPPCTGEVAEGACDLPGDPPVAIECLIGDEPGPVPAGGGGGGGDIDPITCQMLCSSAEFGGSCGTPTCSNVAPGVGWEEVPTCISCNGDDGIFWTTDPPDVPGWGGFLPEQGDPGFRGGSVGGNVMCRQLPEMTCGWFVWRVYENVGGAISETPLLVPSPIPLESDRPDSAAGWGVLSSWHGFIDMDGDDCVDAVWQFPTDKNDTVTWHEEFADDFLVFRGDCLTRAKDDDPAATREVFTGHVTRWKAPPVGPDIRDRARVSYTNLSLSTVTTSGKQHRLRDSLAQLVDVNGDGLPDYVDSRTTATGSGVRVFYNTGTGFETGSSGGTRLSDTLPVIERQVSVPIQYVLNDPPFARRVRVGWSMETQRLIDLDQDGLPDMSDLSPPVANQGNPWTLGGGARMHFNVGDRFIESDASFDAFRPGLAHIQMATASDCGSETPTSPCTDPYAGEEQGTWAVKTDVADFDGDGLLDLYDNPGDDNANCNFTVPGYLSQCGQSNQVRVDVRASEGLRLLATVDNGRGAVVDFSYVPANRSSRVTSTSSVNRLTSPIWVVKELNVTISGETPATTVSSVTGYRYDKPIANRDPNDSFAFRGFETVTIDGPANASGHFARTVETFAYDVDFSGRLVRRAVRDDTGKPLSIETTTWRRLALFGNDVPGGVGAVVEAERSTRICGDTTEPECETSGALERTVSGYAPLYSNASESADPAVSPADALCPSQGFFPVGSVALAYVRCAGRQTEATGPVVSGDRGNRMTFTLTNTLGSGGTTYQVLMTEDKRIQADSAGSGAGWGATTQKGCARSTFDSNGLPKLTSACITDTSLATTDHFYDSVGNLTALRRPVQYAACPLTGTCSTPTTNFTYDTVFKVHLSTTTDEIGYKTKSLVDFATGAAYRTELPAQGSKLPAEERDFDGFGRVIAKRRSSESSGALVLEQIGLSTYTDGAPLSRVHDETWVTYGGGTRIMTDRFYDGAGRLVRMELGSEAGVQTTSYAYDAAGNVVSVAEANPQGDAYGAVVTTTYAHDAFGRVTLCTPPEGARMLVTYTGLREHRVEIDRTSMGPPTDGAATPPSTRPVTLERDVFGRLRRVEERGPGGALAITTYDYDANDNLRHVVDADNIVTDLEHDQAGRRTRISREGRLWRYGYDLEGNLASEITPVPPEDVAFESLYTSTYLYDAADRLISEQPAPRRLNADQAKRYGLGGGGLTSYTYGQPSAGTVNLNSRGRLMRVSLPSGSKIDYFYTIEGFTQQSRLTMSVDPLGTKAIKTTRSFVQTYNALGLPVRTTYPDVNGDLTPTITVTSYDRRGLQQKVELERQAGGSTVYDTLAEVGRNRAGLITQRTSEFSQSAQVAYDKLGRVYVQSVSAGPTVRAGEIWTYDVTAHARQVYDFGTNTAIAYNYDSQDQLTYAGSSDGQRYVAYLSYSPGGRPLTANVISNITTSDVSPRNVTYDYGVPGGAPADLTRSKSLHSLAGAPDVTFSYDESGNLTNRIANGHTTAFFVDGDDRVREAIDDPGASPAGNEVYYYDHAGQRYAAWRSAWNGEPERLRVWLGGSEIWLNKNGGLIKTIASVTLGGEEVARITDRQMTTPEILYHGAQGHLQAVLDGTGALLARFSYGPFGELLSSTGSSAPSNDRRFNGKTHDELSGLDYYGFRYYDRLALQWTQSDARYRFAPDLAYGEPRRAGLYTFSLNNPLRYVDPDGRDSTADLARASNRELHSLVPDYRALLGAAAHPAVGSWADNQHLVNEYLAAWGELNSHVVAQAAGIAYDERMIRSWSEALYRVGDLRRVVAWNLALSYQGHVRSWQRIGKTLPFQGYVEDVEARGEHTKHKVRTVLHAFHAVEIGENLVDGLSEEGIKLLSGGRIGYTLWQGHVSERRVDELVEGVIKGARLAMGYYDDLTLEDVAAKILYYKRKRDEARRLYEVPATGTPPKPGE